MGLLPPAGLGMLPFEANSLTEESGKDTIQTALLRPLSSQSPGLRFLPKAASSEDNEASKIDCGRRTTQRIYKNHRAVHLTF